MKKIALALAALTAATPAFAQDAEPGFTGASAAIIAGYDKLVLNTPGLENPEGVAYGVTLGYDRQVGKAVIGVEAEAAESTANIEVSGTEVANAARDLYVGGRLGFVAGKALVYGKVGYTNARIETIAGSENGDGIRFGGGVELRLAKKLSGKVEYRYSNYEGDIERHQVVAGIGIRF